MRGSQTQMQKTERVEQRLWCVPESIDQSALRRLRGPLALSMTAHAIAGAEQHRLLCKRDIDPILIGVALALKADLCTFDLQASSTAFS